MSLREYKRKRDFTVTAEPAPRGTPSGSGNHFVVQKHDASRLHYDFRLEMDGVLKSWAVPKGFPTKRGERRLAVHVEDHPLDYANFEGTIPAGQYGGGTVMVWDFGTYETGGENPARSLEAGKLRCVLEGEKLRGEWTLVRGARDGDERNWFLIKTGEEGRAITKKEEEHSALSGRTMAQIAKAGDAVWESNRPEKAAAAKTKPAKKVVKKPAGSARPRWIDPMKATLAEAPPVTGDWVYELKWDGYRALAIKDGDQVELVSRNKKPLTADFPEIAAAIGALPAETLVLDGEICALDREGRPSFQLLQGRDLGLGRPELFFYGFDLLHRDGEDLIALSLSERKAALAALFEGAPEELRYSGIIQGDVQQLLQEVRTRGMEGLIAKLRSSPYQPGVRSKLWLKLKVTSEQEFVIGGCTPPQGARKHFGALLVGYYEQGRLRLAGKVGTGFNEAWLKRLSALIEERRLEKCPFVDLPKKSTGRWNQGISAAEMRRCTWCKPELVCQVRFTEWTNDGSLRHPVFLGLREDKEATDVGRERPEAAGEAGL
jgi:bifunctional non-homologous end joining protein LigD